MWYCSYSERINSSILNAWYEYCTLFILQGTSLFQEASKFSTFVQLHNSTHWSIIATTNELSIDPNSRDRSATEKVPHFRTNGLSIRVGVEFHDGILGIHTIEEVFSPGKYYNRRNKPRDGEEIGQKGESWGRQKNENGAIVIEARLQNRVQ